VIASEEKAGIAPAFDVIVCGSLHLDIMVYTPTLPRPDETVAGSRWEQKCGGKGGNQAVMAARAGARTAMIGCVGNDSFGKRLRENLAAFGVDASRVGVDLDVGSGMSVALVQDDGDYGAVIVSGSNLRIAPEGLVAQWAALGGARVLMVQNEISEPANIAVSAAARSSGALVILNAAPARFLSKHLLDQVDILVVNRLEASMLTNETVSSREQAFAAARRLQSGRRTVVVTLGGDGLVFHPPEGEPSWIAPTTVRVVSTHGAGDCFIGTLAARIAAGVSVACAASVASVAAARLVGRLDGAPQ
jgi:ribokinase